MAKITNYSTLVDNVSDWSNRDDLGTVMPTLVQMAESRIQADISSATHGQLITAMDSSDTLTVNSATTALPDDFLKMRSLYVDGSLPMKFVPLDKLRSMPEQQGEPSNYSLSGGNVVWWPTPGDSYTVNIDYFADQRGLSSGDDTRALLTEAPDVYLFATLVEVAGYLEDMEAQAKWMQMYDRALTALVSADQQNRLGAAPLQMIAGMPTP